MEKDKLLKSFKDVAFLSAQKAVDIIKGVRGKANGFASLDSEGKIPKNELDGELYLVNESSEEQRGVKPIEFINISNIVIMMILAIVFYAVPKIERINLIVSLELTSSLFVTLRGIDLDLSNSINILILSSFSERDKIAMSEYLKTLSCSAFAS